MRTKKLMAVLLVMALFAGIFPMPGQTVKAADSYLKKLNLKWDLKKGKNLTLTARYPGIGHKKFNVKVTTFKKEDASKEGYKKLTVQYTVTRKWTPTKKDVDKIINTCYKKIKSDHCYIPFVSAYTVADYETGVSLETKKNDFNVTKKYSKSKGQGIKKFKGTKGNWIKMPKKATVKFQVIYPEDYTGLCIGLLGENKKFDWKDDTTFTDGFGTVFGGSIDETYFTDKTKYIKTKKGYKESDEGHPIRFGDTTYYKKGKKNSHWIHVTE